MFILKAAADNSVEPNVDDLDLPPSIDIEKLRIQLRQLKDFVNAQGSSVDSVVQMATMFGNNMSSKFSFQK